jgi:N6-L-threonylcarbamoyladenine synthase
MIIKDYLESETIGKTIDDAAGEAYDKCAKIMGLPYPGGPLIDKFAKQGDRDKFQFSKPQIPGLDYSFSGLKTSFLYFLRDQVKKENDFIEKNKIDLCASIQHTINSILLEKLILASKETGIKNIAIAGGVSANSGLRDELLKEGASTGWNVFIPEFKYSTDNAAMIALTGYYKFLNKEYAKHSDAPFARIKA